MSKTASILAKHFLLGELPMEAKLHRDIFVLFFCVWSNPDSKIYKIVEFIREQQDLVSAFEKSVSKI